MARIAMRIPSPLKNKAGTSDIRPVSKSQTPSSNIPKFFEISMETHLSYDCLQIRIAVKQMTALVDNKTDIKESRA
jgi:hypothetical protein